jgi:hypothetical protein
MKRILSDILKKGYISHSRETCPHLSGLPGRFGATRKMAAGIIFWLIFPSVFVF